MKQYIPLIGMLIFGLVTSEQGAGPEGDEPEGPTTGQVDTPEGEEVVEAPEGEEFEALAADAPTYPCNDCRNPRRNLRDYRNFAFNKLFGPGRQLTEDTPTSFYIENEAGLTVAVRIDIDIAFYLYPDYMDTAIVWPDGSPITITLSLRNGDTIVYDGIDPDNWPDGLAVPSGAAGGGGGGGGQGGPGIYRSGPPGGSGGSGITRPRTGRCGITEVDGGNSRRTCN